MSHPHTRGISVLQISAELFSQGDDVILWSAAPTPPGPFGLLPPEGQGQWVAIAPERGPPINRYAGEKIAVAAGEEAEGRAGWSSRSQVVLGPVTGTFDRAGYQKREKG